MSWAPFKRQKKEDKRYYLLPGQGGNAYRRKRNFMLTWSVIVGLLLSGALTALLFYLNRMPR
jgi:hypothetical protein